MFWTAGNKLILIYVGLCQRDDFVKVWGGRDHSWGGLLEQNFIVRGVEVIFDYREIGYTS